MTIYVLIAVIVAVLASWGRHWQRPDDGRPSDIDGRILQPPCRYISIDLQKASDTVNRDILLKKLDTYVIRGVMYNWMKDYLTNRQQYVSLQDVCSSSLCVNCGVPQGSVLGPLLFLIYVNDIGNVLPNKTVKLFADDTNILYFIRTFL